MTTPDFEPTTDTCSCGELTTRGRCGSCVADRLAEQQDDRRKAGEA